MTMFKNAKTVTAPAKVTKSNKTEVHCENLKKFAQLKALESAISALTKEFEAGIKDFALDTFIENGQALGKKPESFRGTDGIASASVEFRKRSTTSALTPDQVDFLQTHGLTAKKEVLTVGMFGINPAYAADEKLLEAVSDRLADLVPSDFIVHQEEKSRMVVTDEMIDLAFRNKLPKEVVQTVSILALKPKLEMTDIPAILDDVRELLGTQIAKEDADLTAALKASLVAA